MITFSFVIPWPDHNSGSSKDVPYVRGGFASIETAILVLDGIMRENKYQFVSHKTTYGRAQDPVASMAYQRPIGLTGKCFAIGDIGSNGDCAPEVSIGIYAVETPTEGSSFSFVIPNKIPKLYGGFSSIDEAEAILIDEIGFTDWSMVTSNRQASEGTPVRTLEYIKGLLSPDDEDTFVVTDSLVIGIYK